MQDIYPSYYPHFRCIADRCRHSCCVGWEIDIDPDTLSYYRSIPGELGHWLEDNISPGEPAHFTLSAGDRCPFLNEQNLCRLILSLGEESLCDICAEHPRFYRELSDRTECGLGLCCEEAARLILTWSDPVVLMSGDGMPPVSPFTAFRDAGIALLQNRTHSIPQRVTAMLRHFSARLPALSPEQWARELLKLERLDEEWTRWLTLLVCEGQQPDIAGFDRFMARRQTEYEQLLVCLLYRHVDETDPPARQAACAAFAALGYEIIHALGALYWGLHGELPTEQQVEFVRLFSSEVEYSEENTQTLLQLLQPEI